MILVDSVKCRFYRQQLALEANKRLRRPLPSGQTKPTETDLLLLQKALLVDGNVKPPGTGTGDGEFKVRLESASRTLGLTLTETHGGRAVVHRIAPDSIASAAGILPGDYVVGVGSGREWRFKVVLPSIQAWAAKKKASAAASGSASEAHGKSKGLKLTVWRPQWTPDAFMLQAMPWSTGSQLDQDVVTVEEKLERTTALLDACRLEREVHKSCPVSSCDFRFFEIFMNVFTFKCVCVCVRFVCFVNLV